ncbi:MAG TPA: nuclear transport factor 2 family protein [Chthonomonadaceae bacterium]|nr:nuclear transport factor 2 family protein [Chthonomonadaceae bacterium]
MAIKEVAQGLVNLCREGQFDAAMTRYYAEDIVSVEASGDPAESRGLAAVKAKGQWFMENHEVHGAEVTGPYINGDQFAVWFKLHVTPKATGERTTFEEVGVYTVKDDKVVHERFLSLAA